MTKTNARSRARAAARLAATQALYQHEMKAVAVAPLLHEFHQHRLGATIEDAEYAEAEVDFFDDLYKGTIARKGSIDVQTSANYAPRRALESHTDSSAALLRVGPV